ncbi:translation initiation factor IF3-4, chloroplastic isoform X1 [Prosopis cineraria]|uniref:translation initiation factor IF3-4, chloroplastic isoform X1 n=1 Tax=Prosopis cineraria TaxID=364024 RepID=UPI0024101832|nr:translation initiation factor IF3-4, chloroplastic isoform X1 [Prosopis cineraria]
MAGITSTFPFKLIHSTTSSTSPYLLSPLSSSDSKLFGFRLSNPNSLKLDPPVSISFAPVTARYGGGDSRRYRNNSDDEQVLDLDNIRSDTVRLIDENQNMIGVVSTSQAIQMAEDAELDLVIVSPDADPPVVRIIDFNKYRYEQQKKKRGQQKKSAANRMDLKELKMGYNIDQHDYSVRLKAAQKFLKDGDKVKVIVNLKGRENEFRNIAIELIRRFQNDVGELAAEESKNFRDRNIFIVLVPNKAVLQKAQEPPKKKDKSAADEVSASVQA